MTFKVPAGFSLAGVSCGIKEDTSKLDLMLIASDRPSVAAGVYTQNRIVSPTVVFDRSKTPCDNFRVLVANSGNANACTGERGDQDVVNMARLAAEATDATNGVSLVLSTGIIGVYMPMEIIAAGIKAAAAEMSDSETSLTAAAKAIMTTDSRHKVAGREIRCGSQKITITGIAKGAAMIGPKMATMLAVVMTDAPLKKEDAQQMLGEVVNDTFNCISVEGHMSTNDSVLLLASGAAGEQALAGDELAAFRDALHEVCTELAMSIPDDGEGVTHRITIDVRGCETREAAHAIARTVADSALVKTAVAGADPNWGRIVSAAGYAGVEFDPAGVSLKVNGFQLFDRGTPVEFDDATVSNAIRDNRDTHLELAFGEGTAEVRFWTTDLTQEYVRLNADYRT